MRKAVLFLLSVATAVLTGPWVPLSAAEVTVVSRPPSAGENPFYVGNREPLVPNPLLKLSIGAIEPRGWLGHQLELARDGMVGQLAELSRWCKPDDNAWLSPTGAGKHGWEELPYWLKGYGDLGYVLGDEEIMAAARHKPERQASSGEAPDQTTIDRVLDHLRKSNASGTPLSGGA